MTLPILLIGKSGQVGKELVSLLPQLGTLTALDRCDLDLANPRDIRDTVRRLRPRIIINAAAFTAVDRAETEVNLAFAVNATAADVLADEAKRIRSVLVHYSTDYVFDGLKTTPYSEVDSTNPLSIYGKSKLAGEEAIRRSAVPHLIFRISWVYSAHGQNFLLNLLRLSAQRQELRMVNDQRGVPNWAHDIAVSTIKAILTLSASSKASVVKSFERVSGTYHMSATGEATRFDFSQAILEERQNLKTIPEWVTTAAGGNSFLLSSLVPVPSSEFPVPAARPLYSVLSSDLLSKVFEIEPAPWRARLHRLFVDSTASLP